MLFFTLASIVLNLEPIGTILCLQSPKCHDGLCSDEMFGATKSPLEGQNRLLRPLTLYQAPRKHRVLIATKMRQTAKIPNSTAELISMEIMMAITAFSQGTHAEGHGRSL
ncbi:hypothetical protein EV126DRAFT_413044 [Verticillium dahliae]|nr:hypothetical protein EV126DRAFT_413044 [Verticillium dahliae]